MNRVAENAINWAMKKKRSRVFMGQAEVFHGVGCCVALLYAIALSGGVLVLHMLNQQKKLEPDK